MRNQGNKSFDPRVMSQPLSYQWRIAEKNKCAEIFSIIILKKNYLPTYSKSVGSKF